MMNKTMTRRTIVSGAVCAAAFIPALSLVGSRRAAAALPALDPNDPAAKALGYTTDTSKVDAAANPTHKAEQSCASCAQYVAATEGCNLFPGKSVVKTGWCKVYAKKA